MYGLALCSDVDFLTFIFVKNQILKFFKHGYGCFVFVIYILMSRASIIYSISGGTTDTDALGERFALFDLSSVV